MTVDIASVPLHIQGLEDTRTVDRRLAHKDSTEQVFVNAVARDGDAYIALGALPRVHRFFNDVSRPRYDALLITEYVRQAIEVLAHALLEVPLTHQMVLRSLELEFVDPAATVIDGRAVPAVVVLPGDRVRRNREGAVYAADGPVECFIGGRLAARIGGTVAFLAREAYQDLRAASGEAVRGVPRGVVTPHEPRAVGRRFAQNVFIGVPEGPPRRAHCLVVPQAHPAFFDRPLDHYPGMVIAEAARQLAVASAAVDAGVPAGWVGTEYAALEFVSFAELGRPPRLEMTGWSEHDSGVEVTVTARQGARLNATCGFQLSRKAFGEAH